MPNRASTWRSAIAKVCGPLPPADGATSHLEPRWFLLPLVFTINSQDILGFYIYQSPGHTSISQLAHRSTCSLMIPSLTPPRRHCGGQMRPVMKSASAAPPNLVINHHSPNHTLTNASRKACGNTQDSEPSPQTDKLTAAATLFAGFVRGATDGTIDWQKSALIRQRPLLAVDGDS